MTVQELIDELQKIPDKEAEVMLTSYDGQTQKSFECELDFIVKYDDKVMVH